MQTFVAFEFALVHGHVVALVAMPGGFRGGAVTALFDNVVRFLEVMGQIPVPVETLVANLAAVRATRNTRVLAITA